MFDSPPIPTGHNATKLGANEVCSEPLVLVRLLDHCGKFVFRRFGSQFVHRVCEHVCNFRIGCAPRNGGKLYCPLDCGLV